jgi:Meckel syndrome type 1 protein
MRRIQTACLLGLSALVLTACTKDEGAFPSLARRPAERLNAPAPEATPTSEPTQAASDPALIERIAALEAQARTAHERFSARTGPARTAATAAAGAAVASEAWSVATVALSELESARSETVIALADLDALYARAVVAGTDSAALAAAREAVVALVGEEDRVLGELHGKLSQ